MKYNVIIHYAGAYDVDEFETKEEAEKEYNEKFTDEEWGEQIARRGGFKDWDFEI